MRIRASLLLAAALAMFGADPVGTLATSSHLSDSSVLRGASARLLHQRPAQVIRWLQRRGGVSRVGLERDHRTLAIHFRDGRVAYVLPAQLSTAKISVPALHHGAVPMVRAQQGVARAAVLEPFASELGLGPNAGDPEVADLQKAGFQVDQAYDQSVTVSTMSTLSNYNVVYMHTHTGPVGSQDGVVATGQLDPSCPYVPSNLASLGVVCVGVAGSTATYYAITSSFVSSSMGTFPRNALLYFNGCELLGATSFWQALARKGAGVMVSWDNWSATYDDYLSAAAFFNQAAGGATVSGAITTLKANGYGVSNTSRGTAHLGYDGDGSITLAGAASGGSGSSPTSTPAPAPTSTSTPTRPPGSTPTPRPSPTSVHVAIPLSIVSMVSHVLPGSTERIAVHTSGGAQVSLRVTFPNGGVRNLIQTADSAGNLTFSFKQAGSTITHASNRASMVLTARAGQDIQTITKSYTIGFSKLDVSVEPAQGSPGQKVWVWVHSRAHTTVSVVATLPHHTPGKLAGKTGKKGWAPLHYRIPRGVTAGQKIKMSAKTTLGGTLYKATATLTIR